MISGRSDIFGISLISQHAIQVNQYSHVRENLNMDELRLRNEALWKRNEDLAEYQVLGINYIQSTPVLTIVRKIYDTYTYKTSGLLIVDLRLNQIEKICHELALSQFEDIWIINEGGKIIYHPEQVNLGETISFHDQLHKGQSEGFFINQGTDKDDLIVYTHSDQSNWSMAANVPLNQIIMQLIQLRNYTVVIGLFLIGFALIFVGGFSFSLTHSLSNLQRLMKKAQSGNLNLKQVKPLTKRDEISDLYRSFYSMTSELKKLIEEVHTAKLKEKELELKNRESELRSMQSQINPHFLYNTLEIINSYAIVEKQFSISKIATALADMFRYNIGNVQKIVTLREELDHIQSYLQIQKERYDDLAINMTINDDDIREVQTVRLTLQPILENCFIHAYEEHQLKPEFIGIYGEKADQFYMLRIIDRGKGMDSSTKTTYNKAFMHNTEPKIKSRKSKGIGLFNVHKRIRSTFGNAYGLYIEKSDQEGTIIGIKLPYVKSEK